MANLLEDSALMTLFALDGEQMQVLFAFFNDLFAAALPALHAHFAMHDIEPQLYLVEWIFTLFSKCLPPQVAGWIWDHICIVGEHYIFSVRTPKAKHAMPIAWRFVSHALVSAHSRATGNCILLTCCVHHCRRRWGSCSRCSRSFSC